VAVIEKRVGKKGTSYRVLIRKKGEKTISKTFTKKAIAQAWAIKKEAEIERGEFCNDYTNVGSLIKRYIVEVGKYNPIGSSKMCSLEMLRRELGHLKLKDLDGDLLYNFAVARNVKPCTLQSDMGYLGAVLSIAESLWNMKPNLKEYKRCMNNLQRFGLVGASDERDRRVSDFELTEILNNVNSRLAVSLHDVVWFAVHTAMRRGEICSLRWEDLREDGKSIIVRSRKHPRKKRDQLVPLLPKAREIICRQARNSVYIFPVKPRSVSAAFTRAKDKTDIEDLRFHDLRHEGISRLFELGLDSMVVAVFSGHRDINMLRRYTHINANKILKMLDCNPIDMEHAA